MHYLTFKGFEGFSLSMLPDKEPAKYFALEVIERAKSILVPNNTDLLKIGWGTDNIASLDGYVADASGEEPEPSVPETEDRGDGTRPEQASELRMRTTGAKCGSPRRTATSSVSLPGS